VEWTCRVLTLPGMTRAVALRKSFEPLHPDTPKKPDEWHYYATSAPARRLGADKLARTAHEHWCIENGLHWRKDVTLGEDRHVLRKGNAPIVMSALRSWALGLIDLIVIPSLPAQTVPQKTAYLAGNIDRVLAMLNDEPIK
jgi:hypothetical protein